MCDSKQGLGVKVGPAVTHLSCFVTFYWATSLFQI